MVLGLWQILIILFVAFLLFGSKKLPDMGTSMGKAIKNFKKSLSEDEEEEEEEKEKDVKLIEDNKNDDERRVE